MSILSVENLHKTYKGGVKAVDGISFEVSRGECFGLLGPNGAGKTTTIEALEGIMPFDQGRIKFNGELVSQLSKDLIGIQFQSTALPDYLKVKEVLELFSSFYSKNSNLDELIDMCNLEEYLDRDHRNLSGGQKQRLLLALALVNDPELVFLDEPTTGLDPQARRNFWKLVRLILERNKTVIMTTHYMEEAYELCHRIAIVDRGKIIAEGSPESLLEKHFSGARIRIPKNDLAEFATQGPWNVLREDEVMELFTEDVDQSLKYLIESDVSLRNLTVVNPTLDDLFLELTGRDLRES